MSKMKELVGAYIKNLELRLEILQSQLESTKLDADYMGFVIKDIKNLFEIEDIANEREEKNENTINK